MKSCNTDFTFSIFTSSQTKLYVKFKFVIYRVKSIQLFALYFMMKVIGLRNFKLGHHARRKMC